MTKLYQVGTFRQAEHLVVIHLILFHGDVDVPMQKFQERLLQEIQFCQWQSTHRGEVRVIVVDVVINLGAQHETNCQQPVDAEYIDFEISKTLHQTANIHKSAYEARFAEQAVLIHVAQILLDTNLWRTHGVEHVELRMPHCRGVSLCGHCAENVCDSAYKFLNVYGFWLALCCGT